MRFLEIQGKYKPFSVSVLFEKAFFFCEYYNQQLVISKTLQALDICLSGIAAQLRILSGWVYNNNVISFYFDNVLY